MQDWTRKGGFNEGATTKPKNRPDGLLSRWGCIFLSGTIDSCKCRPIYPWAEKVVREFYYHMMQNLFDTMKIILCFARFFPDVAEIILLNIVLVMNSTRMLMGPSKGLWGTVKYEYLSQYQLPHAQDIIITFWMVAKIVLAPWCLFGKQTTNNILPWLHDDLTESFCFRGVTCS